MGDIMRSYLESNIENHYGSYIKYIEVDRGKRLL